LPSAISTRCSGESSLQPLMALWRRALSPAVGFRERAAEEPTLGSSLRFLFLVRTPLTFASLLLEYWGIRAAYHSLRGMEGETGTLLSRFLPEAMSAAELRAALAELPLLPELRQVIPWLVLTTPLLVLGLWLHDAVWDHGCLWMLRGVKPERGFRASLIAEAEALSVGSLGAAAGLLSALPVLGNWLALPLAALGLWFWILRGFALAAWQECPVWKGIAATLLHAVLAACCLAGLLGFCIVFLAAALA